MKSDKRFSLMGPMRRKYASVDSLWRSAVHLVLEQHLGQSCIRSSHRDPGTGQPPSSLLFLVVRPGAPSSVLVPSSDARSP